MIPMIPEMQQIWPGPVLFTQSLPGRRRRIIMGCSQFPVWTWTLQQSLQHCTQRRPCVPISLAVVRPEMREVFWVSFIWVSLSFVTSKISSSSLTNCARNFCYPSYLGTNLGWGRRSVTSVSGNHSLRGARKKIAQRAEPRDHLERTLGYSTWLRSITGSKHLTDIATAGKWPQLIKNTREYLFHHHNIWQSKHRDLYYNNHYYYSYTLLMRLLLTA